MVREGAGAHLYKIFIFQRWNEEAELEELVGAETESMVITVIQQINNKQKKYKRVPKLEMLDKGEDSLNRSCIFISTEKSGKFH